MYRASDRHEDDGDAFLLDLEERKTGLFKRESTTAFDSQMSIVGGGSSTDDDVATH